MQLGSSHHIAAAWLAVAGQVMAMGLVTLCSPSPHTMEPNVYLSATLPTPRAAKVISYACVLCVALNRSFRGFTVTRTPAGPVTLALYVALALFPTLFTTRRCETASLAELSTAEKAG